PCRAGTLLGARRWSIRRRKKYCEPCPTCASGLAGFGRRRQKRFRFFVALFPARSGEGRNPPHNSSLRARRQAGLSAELGLAARLRRGRLLDRPLLVLLPLQLLLSQKLLLALQVRRSVVRRGAAWRLLPGLRNGERLDLDRLL